jgi:hypothetical protein
MEEFARRLSEMNKKNEWNYELVTCGEKEIFTKHGIKKNSCVDDNLMIRIAHTDAALMKFLGVNICDLRQNAMDDLFASSPIPIPNGAIMLSANKYAIKNKDNKDKGQRALCGCMVSKDIGEYNTCPHQCEYCYANTSKATAIANYKCAKETQFKSETITGK